MADPEYGPWAPMTVEEAGALFASAPHWYVSGGTALELFSGRSWRSHDDLDIGVLRRDVPTLRSLLAGWDVHLAAGRVLTPWGGQPLDGDRGENNLWCRSDPEGPWRLDLVIGAGDDERWRYRRDLNLSLPWEEAVLESADGLPYLAPQVQLLFKSKDPRPKDELDAVEIIPELGREQRAWLARTLPPDHRWLAMLA
jgi:hypothetical protein